MLTRYWTRRDFLRAASGSALALPLWARELLPQPDNSNIALKTDVPLEQVVAEIEAFLPATMKEIHIPGVSLALIRDGELVWSHGYGVRDVRTRHPVDENTVFDVASLGKPLFALGVMLLVDQGKLYLDRSLLDYMPDAFVPAGPLMAEPNIPDDPRLKLITPRIVLRHATGLPNWSEGKRLEFEFTPGEGYSYSGEAYFYLQRVVEHLTGQPLEEFMRRTVFEPLEMHCSSYVWRDAFEQVAATGHDNNGTPLEKNKPVRALSSGSLHTTANDYARFVVAMVNPAKAAKVQVHAELLAEMLRPQNRRNESISWGLGWGLQSGPSGPAFWHWGNNPGFESFTICYPAPRLGVVILTNGARGLRLCKELVPLAIGGGYPAYFLT